jgi:hypothetical protein
MTQFHVVGIDWSMSKTGVAVHRPGTDVEPILRLVKSDPLDVADGHDMVVPMLYRLQSIVSRTRKIALEGFDPDVDIMIVVVEGPSYGSMKSKQIHQETRAGLRWIGAQTFERLGRPQPDGRPGAFITVPPASLKRYVTKDGSASKDKMKERAHEVAFPTINFRPTPNGVIDDNLVDAYGLVAMADRVLGFPVEPSPQRVDPNALNGVRWPAFMEQNRSNT